MVSRKAPDSDEKSTVARPKYDPSAIASSTFRIVVAAGPDQGTAVTLDGTQPAAVLVGQSPSCDLRLTDREVSRRHASLELTDGRLRLVDLGSTNGTSVNGVGIGEAFLKGGETISVGGTRLNIELVAANTVAALPGAVGFGRVVGASPNMRRIYPLCERLAATNVPVIIEGETGTGKELLAEALHECGARAAGPFIVFDCTSVPANLVESDLFGHERGAFTGAISARKGVFELANGGTLLIDEIGDLEASLQPKLLRVLERSEVRRVGADRPTRVDVRVLSATRRDLDREVAAGRFRDDLFHRLAVTRIELPPLRRRAGDVPLLVRAFCRQLGADENVIPAGLLRRWEDLAWPGNVRELRNAVARYLAVGDLAAGATDAIRDDARASVDGATPGEGALERLLAMRLPFTSTRHRVLEEFERRYIERILAEHGGNMMRAAAASGIARRHLQRVRARIEK